MPSRQPGRAREMPGPSPARPADEPSGRSDAIAFTLATPAAPAAALLCLLLIADAAFVALHLLHSFTSWLPNGLYGIEAEKGYAAVFQFVQEFWIVCAVLVLATRESRLMYGAWTALFCYVLLDDALALHEHAGDALAAAIGASRMGWLRTEDIGELGLTALAGVTLLSLVLIGHRFATDAARRTSVQLLALLAALCFFGVALDLVHELFTGRAWRLVVATIEDGGELVVISMITAFVFKRAWIAPAHPESP